MKIRFNWKRKAPKLAAREQDRSQHQQNQDEQNQHQQNRQGVEASKEETKSVKRSAKRLLSRRRSRHHRSRRSASEKRRRLEELLRKAGYEIDVWSLKRAVFYLSFTLVSLFTLLTLVVAASAGKSATDLLLFYAGVWTAVFAFLYLLFWMIIFVYLDLRIYHRTRQVEAVLPDFLQLVSANISAGMPIDRALWFAVRPNFGVLAKEIEEVAKATLAGEELSASLTAFTEKYDSVTLRRSINILLEGLEAGGELASLINKIALNIQETNLQQKEMSANVATYAIFITFASIVMAPVLFALATELLSIIVRITSTLDLSSSTGSFISLNIKTTPRMVPDFRLFSVVTLSISALMSASIVSVIRRGRVKEGLRNLPIFLVVSLTLYFLARSALHAMFAGLI